MEWGSDEGLRLELEISVPLPPSGDAKMDEPVTKGHHCYCLAPRRDFSWLRNHNTIHVLIILAPTTNPILIGTHENLSPGEPMASATIS